MKTPLKLLSLVLGVVILVAGGYAFGRISAQRTPAPAQEPEPSPRTASTPSNQDALALSKALSEIDALKAERKSLQDALAAQQAQDPEQAQQGEQPRRRSWQERMEEMKKNDPERYKAEMERRERFMNEMAQARTERANFLDDIDTDLLSQEQKQVHAQYVATLAKQDALEQEFRKHMEEGTQPTEELQTAMRETRDAMRSLREAERSALLSAIATSMGLSGNAVSDFSELVTDVFSATSGFPGRMRGAQPPPPQPAQ